MKETFQLHQKYEAFREKLKEVISNFDTDGEYVVKGERNSIKKFEIDGTVFNIKQFKIPNFFQGLVYQYLRKSKASRSFEYAIRLIDKGISTPFPVAYYERFSTGLKESFYLSLHLDYDFDFRVLNHNPKWPNRNEILKQFATFTFRLHENGIRFLDHSPGNTLIIQKDEYTYEFYLIDLNRMRFGSMEFSSRMKNFRRLWLSKTMINVMAPVYAELSGEEPHKTHRLMTHFSRKFQKKVNSKKLRRRRRRNNQ